MKRFISSNLRIPCALWLAACFLAMLPAVSAQGRKIKTPFPQPPQAQPNIPQQMKIRVEDDLVTGVVQNVPLQDALSELAARTGIVFEVAQQYNDAVSVSFYKIPVGEATQRLIGPGNSIFYYGDAGSGQNRIQFVQVFNRPQKSPQASLRYIGTGAITKTGDDVIDSPEQAVSALAQSRNTEVRQKAVEVLVATKSETANQALILAIEDEAPEVRAAAIEGLASLGARSALPQILQHLKDKHPGVRQSAIVAVALLGDVDNLKDIRPMGRDQDASVAAAAEIAIKKLAVRHP